MVMTRELPSTRKRWGFWPQLLPGDLPGVGGLEVKMAFYIVTKTKSGKRYHYLVQSYRQDKKVVQKRVERIGSIQDGSPPVAELLGEPVTQALIGMWKERGRPRLPISQGITIGDLEKYIYQPRSLLSQEALDVILKVE
jgi:hypothetical protein